MIMTGNRKKYFLKFWFPVIIYAVLIFWGSSLEAPFTVDFEIIGLNKAFHILEYAVFGFLLARAAAVSLPTISPSQLIFIIFIVGTFYGFTDEFHQYFIPGRNVSILDLLSDAIGSFLGAFIFIKGKGAGFTKRHIRQ